MAVLITAKVHGQTPEGYDGMLSVLAEPLKRADGMIFHSAYAADGEWMVLEVWDTKEQADRFFAQNVAPHLPPGVRPKRTVQTLHSAVTPSAPGNA